MRFAASGIPAYYIADIPKGRALKSKKIIFAVLCAGYCKIFLLWCACIFQPLHRCCVCDIIFVIWDAGGRIMNNKEKGKSKAVMYIGFAIGAVIGAVLVGLVFNSVEIGGEKGLMMQAFALGAIFLAALIYGIVKKRKSMIAFSLCEPVLAGAAMFGAVNDFPRFIRKIQGEDFIGILFTFMGIVLALYFVIELIVCGI